MRWYELKSPMRRLAAAIVAMLAIAAGPATAHEIPDAVKVEAFLRPAGQRLELLMRVPMSALIEVDFPTRGPGYINLPRVEEALHGAVKLYITDNITVYENEKPLPTPRVVQVRISLPSDRSFASYETALANLHGPRVADDLELYWNQQLLDVLLEYPIESERSQFAIHPRVDRYGAKVTTALLFMPPARAIRAFEFHGDPGLVHLDPSWQQAARRFIVSGFWHILDGTDHLLFVACLVIPFRRLRSLGIIIAAFTVAHSISLFAGAVGFVPDALWFPPLIGTLIAVTILYVALENIIGSEVTRRWIIAFAFGLIHGFAFSFSLREIFQFAGDHPVIALFGFNLGIELGQLLVLLLLVPVLDLLFKYVVAERLGIIILSAFVAHAAWHWMLERGQQLAKFPFPKIDAALLASAMRGLMAILILGGLVAMVNNMLKRWIQGSNIAPARDPAE
jgi:HupE / UreJ protein